MQVNAVGTPSAGAGKPAPWCHGGGWRFEHKLAYRPTTYLPTYLHIYIYIAAAAYIATSCSVPKKYLSLSLSLSPLLSTNNDLSSPVIKHGDLWKKSSHLALPRSFHRFAAGRAAQRPRAGRRRRDPPGSPWRWRCGRGWGATDPVEERRPPKQSKVGNVGNL